MTNKKYNIIYADPPWQYKVYSKKGQGRSAESHYPTMSLEDIQALPVRDLAAADCVLFMWTTIPLLKDCFSVMRACGFTYKTVAFVSSIVITLPYCNYIMAGLQRITCSRILRRSRN